MYAEESLHVNTVVASPIGGMLQRKIGRLFRVYLVSVFEYMGDATPQWP